jgi:hypothetical protein
MHYGVWLEGDEHNILKKVRQSLQHNMQEEPVVMVAHGLCKDKGQGTVKSAEWSESDRLLMFRGKIYVPKDRELRYHIIKQHHTLDMQAASKYSSLYHTTIGGPRCPDT